MNDIISYLKHMHRTKTSYTLLAAPERFHICTISILNPWWFQVAIYIHSNLVNTYNTTHFEKYSIVNNKKTSQTLTLKPNNILSYMQLWIIFVNEDSLSGITWNALLWIKNSLSWNTHLWIITEMAPLVINLLVLK